MTSQVIYNPITKLFQYNFKGSSPYFKNIRHLTDFFKKMGLYMLKPTTKSLSSESFSKFLVYSILLAEIIAYIDIVIVGGIR